MQGKKIIRDQPLQQPVREGLLNTSKVDPMLFYPAPFCYHLQCFIAARGSDLFCPGLPILASPMQILTEAAAVLTSREAEPVIVSAV